MTTILIADDHAVVRSGLRALLSEQPNWHVVAEAADGKEAVAQVLKTAPDVAIIDYSLPLLGRELINAQPYTDRCQLHERQIVCRKFVVASGDTSAVFDAVEEPLDSIARTI
jgi:DNA-binding NarL/FixJ family response regulator